MTNFLLINITIMTIYFFSFQSKESSFDFMDINHTTLLKGFAILTVLWSHIGGELGVNYIQTIAGIGVSIFIICSGYGLTESYKKRGLDGFFKNRITKIVFLFWIVELIGLTINGVSKGIIIKDLLFITPATSYGWFMQYILICYCIFWAVMKVHEKNSFIGKHTLLTFNTIFIAWFILESLYFAKEGMPELRARQMFAFPIGYYISINKMKLKLFIEDNKLNLELVMIIIGLTISVISQMDVMNNFKIIFTNILSLFTVMPIGIAIIMLSWRYKRILENRLFEILGNLSFEIYLIHSFTLSIIKEFIISIILFIIVTCTLTLILYKISEFLNRRRESNGRYNGNYIN